MSFDPLIPLFLVWLVVGCHQTVKWFFEYIEDPLKKRDNKLTELHQLISLLGTDRASNVVESDYAHSKSIINLATNYKKADDFRKNYERHSTLSSVNSHENLLFKMKHHFKTTFPTTEINFGSNVNQ